MASGEPARSYHPCLSRWRHAGGRILVRGYRSMRRIEIVTNSGPQDPSARRGRRDHRHIGRQLHRARVWPVWRKLFDDYEARFLKRNVQGELTARFLDPMNWGALSSTGWGRSELAAQLYDQILFNGATFADLYRAGGPMIAVSATELTTGSRVVFIPQNFNVMCADLGPIRLSRAAAASSAVPVVLSPITINNYGGSCGYRNRLASAVF